MGVEISAGGLAVRGPESWGGTNEWSDSAKFYHPTRGRGWVEVGGKTVRLAPEQLYLVPPHSKVSYGAESEIVIEWLHFSLVSPWLDVRLGSLPGVQVFDNATAERWKRTCGRIERFVARRAADDAFFIHSMLLEVAGLAFERLPTEDPRARQSHERLMPALLFLNSQANKRPSLRDAARTVHLSPEHFHRLFQSVFYTTPMQYARARRMRLAEGLLSEGKLSVAEVAEQCGYDDPFYFSRVFRQYFGVRPGKVRQGLAIIGPKP
ncbi:MAG: AraC family transcriptional regulator [Terrimicrobiaceae bacterium]|nr:AraC family transcriptional regulator [Terrimicrobiaceae bacterium]